MDEALCGRRDPARRRAARLPSHHALDCQRAIGNRATSSLIQAALTLSRPGDRCEQEAERVAAEVARRFDARTSCEGGVDPKPAPTVGRGLSTLVSRSAEGGIGIDAAPEMAARIDAARGSGQALPESVRTAMEPLFGADFRGVRVHADAQAHMLNRALEARAFTTGHDIFFGHGHYQPASRRGVELLAHELTHVVQQSRRTPGTAASGSLVMRDVTEVKGAGDPVKDRYETENFEYGVGDLRHQRKRPVKVTVFPWKAQGEKKTPHPISFKGQGDVLDDIAGYHRGHIFGYSLGGPAAEFNIVPMLARFNGSTWKNLENALRDAVPSANKGNYMLDVLIDYTGSLDPRIPKRLTVSRAKRVMEDEWNADGDPITLAHEVVEPTQSAERSNQINAALASVHRPEDGPKVRASTAFRNHLLVRHDMLKHEADDAAALLLKNWHLPPLERCYPDSVAHRPYEELDLLYFAGQLPNQGSGLQTVGGAFTKQQKPEILACNRARNGGVLHSDDPRDRHTVLRVGGTLDRPEIDHIVPTDRGGSNYFSNAKVISFELNNKGERVKNPGPYFEAGTMPRRDAAKLDEDVMDVLAELRDEFESLETIVETVSDRRPGMRAATRKKIATMLDQLVADGIVERMVEISDDTGEELGDIYRMRAMPSLRRMSFPLA